MDASEALAERFQGALALAAGGGRPGMFGSLTAADDAVQQGVARG
jgi:hypothetical protein